MIASCVNCGTEFLHASEGRLFYQKGGQRRASPQEVEFYWLCGKCSAEYTLKISPGGQVHAAVIQKQDEEDSGARPAPAPDPNICPNCTVLALASD